MITWDFDVIKGDVIFTVFRHKRPKEACSGSLTSLGESPSCGVIANVDAVVVEKPKTCHDGDSIQVSVWVRFEGEFELRLLILIRLWWRNQRHSIMRTPGRWVFGEGVEIRGRFECNDEKDKNGELIYRTE